MGQYDGKRVVITGGTSGIGLATAKLLLDQGARVLVTGRAKKALDSAREELGKNAIVMSSDATLLPDIDALAARAKSEFGTDVSGQFFASAPKRVTGPMEAMRHPHFHDRATQEAAWQAVVRVSGVDFSSAAPLSAAF